MNLSGDDSKPLKEWLDERRDELDATLEELAEAAGLSVEGVRLVATGKRTPRSRTRRKIERGWQWEPGSLDAIDRGEPPARIAGSPGADSDDSREERVRAQIRRLREALPRDEFRRLIVEELDRMSDEKSSDTERGGSSATS